VSTLAALATHLEAEGLGTGGTDLFYGSTARIPTGEGPYTLLRQTGGMAPWGTHNDGPTAIRRPTVHVVVRGTDYTAVETRAAAVYAALTFVGLTVGGVRFLKATPLQSEPADLGLDNGQLRLGFNVALERQE
jgi:Bacteriophage minor capsid protein